MTDLKESFVSQLLKVRIPLPLNKLIVTPANSEC